jgi:DNA segregation ATPase FtsK/SpoIIIE-like protein
MSQIEYRARADRELHDEARAIAGDLENSLSTLGFDYHFSRDKKRVHKTVHALRYQVTPDEIRVQIDTRPGKLPHGVNTTDMTNPDVIKSLTASIGADIQVHFDRGGLWYRVYRNSGVFGIPSYVKFNDMIAQIGKRDGPLVVAVGVGQGRKVIKANFDNESFCHWLIAGSTGMGKTTLLHSIISQLAMRDPAHIRMVLIDLKRYELKR